MKDIEGNNNEEKIGFSFKKEERLCSKNVISKLFLEGESLFVFPVKIVYLKTSLKTARKAQVAFSVPKRNFKKAVDRNLIKRRMREAYRLNKPDFYKELEETQLAVFFVYSGKTILEYREIERSIKKGLKKLMVEIDRGNL